MTELKFAIENNVAIETKKLNGEIVATWNNGSSVEVISIEQAKELGLVKDKTVLQTNVTIDGAGTMGRKSIIGMKEEEFYSTINKVANDSKEGSNIWLEIRNIPTEEEAKTIAEKFPKSYKVNPIGSHRNRDGSSMYLWIKTDENKNISKNAQSKVKKFVSIMKELGFLK